MIEILKKAYFCQTNSFSRKYDIFITKFKIVDKMMKLEENDEWSEILEKSIFLSNLFLKEFEKIYKKFKKCIDTMTYSTKHNENDKYLEI